MQREPRHAKCRWLPWPLINQRMINQSIHRSTDRPTDQPTHSCTHSLAHSPTHPPRVSSAVKQGGPLAMAPVTARCSSSRASRSPERGLRSASQPTSCRSATTCSSKDSRPWQSKWNEFWKSCQFESWAPRSSRAWRLREIPSEVELKGEALSTADVTAFAAEAGVEMDISTVG